MPKEEWGTKRICPTTGKRFYDLNKTPIVSPYTGETVTLDQNTKTRVAIPSKAEKKAKEDADSPDLAEDDEAVLEGDDDSVDLDDDILEDEDDDNVSLDEIADVASDDEDS